MKTSTFPLWIFLFSLLWTVASTAESEGLNVLDNNSSSSSRSTNDLISADPKYATNLIQSFQSFCPTNGNWTSNSLASARKIEKFIESLRDDPDCIGMAQALANDVNSLAYALENIEYSFLEREIMGSEREQSEILFLLENEDDPYTIQGLRSIFRENQLGLARKRGRLRYDERKARNQYQANVILNSATRLFRQATLGQQCILRSPQFFSNLFSLGANLAAISTTGGASLGFAATSTILGNTFGLIRKSKLNRHIRKLGQEKFVAAYQCVMESLSNQWCQARETYDLLEFKMQENKTNPDPFLSGVRIIDYELPVLMNWLNDLRSATLPQNTSISQRQIQFIERETSLRVWKLDAIARLRDAQKKLPPSDSDEDKEKKFYILQRLIVSLNPAFSQEQRVINPVNEITSGSELPWLLAGVPLKDVPTTTNFSGRTVLIGFEAMTATDFQSHPTLVPHYPFFETRILDSILKLEKEAAALISGQRNSILHADPEFLFFEAENDYYRYHALGKEKKVSPLAAIDNILDYLKDHYEGDFSSDSCTRNNENNEDYADNRQKVIKETQIILCQTKAQVKGLSKDPTQRLKEIYQLTKLENGTTFIEQRIQAAIELILVEQLLENKDQEISLKVKLLVVDNIINELDQYGSSNLSMVKLDVLNALRNSEMTLQNFAEIFADGIGKALRQVHNKNNGSNFHGPLLAKYCSLLLTIPDWNSKELLKKIDLSLCHGKALKSFWRQRNSPFEFQFSSKLYHSSFGRRRMCHLRRFLRKEKYHQRYRN
ncbi:MAG: hypothetical protein OXB88_04910 [Bacteriovoracales bacterium]|nr:hypothetical protein [Bacteriovoracales bacterium]